MDGTYFPFLWGTKIVTICYKCLNKTRESHKFQLSWFAFWFLCVDTCRFKTVTFLTSSGCLKKDTLFIPVENTDGRFWTERIVCQFHFAVSGLTWTCWSSFPFAFVTHSVNSSRSTLANGSNIWRSGWPSSTWLGKESQITSELPDGSRWPRGSIQAQICDFPTITTVSDSRMNGANLSIVS